MLRLPQWPTLLFSPMKCTPSAPQLAPGFHRQRLRCVFAMLGVLLSGAASAQLGGLGGTGDVGGVGGGLGSVEPDALSSPLKNGRDAHDELRRDPRMSRAEAAQSAREIYGGRILAVRWTGRHYRVKLLRDGEIRFITLQDGETVRSRAAESKAGSTSDAEEADIRDNADVDGEEAPDAR